MTTDSGRCDHDPSPPTQIRPAGSDASRSRKPSSGPPPALLMLLPAGGPADHVPAHPDRPDLRAGLHQRPAHLAAAGAVRRRRQLHPAVRRRDVLEVAAQHDHLRGGHRAGAVGAARSGWRCWSTSRCAGVNFFRTVYFLPVVTSMVVVSMLWLFMYQPERPDQPGAARSSASTGPDWLGDPHTALLAIILMSVWQAMGFHMVIWLSGLQTIPGDLYEAADARRRQQVAEVPLRHLARPAATRTFILITITISAFSLFTQVNIMTQGGPLDSTSTLVLHGGPHRLPAAADRLRLGDLAGLLRAGARRLPRPALPHPRQGR